MLLSVDRISLADSNDAPTTAAAAAPASGSGESGRVSPTSRRPSWNVLPFFNRPAGASVTVESMNKSPITEWGLVKWKIKDDAQCKSGDFLPAKKYFKFPRHFFFWLLVHFDLKEQDIPGTCKTGIL